MRFDARKLSFDCSHRKHKHATVDEQGDASIADVLRTVAHREWSRATARQEGCAS